MDAPPLWVSGLGACTAIGRDAASSVAAARAGISGFSEHPYMVDTAGEPMRVAYASWLDIDCAPEERFEALLLPSIDQAMRPLRDLDTWNPRIGLVLGTPAARPGLPSDLPSTLRARLLRQFPKSFVAVAVFPVGHAGPLLGLHAAAKKIAEDAFDGCVVAGVESYLAPETLEWLEEEEQLHSAGRLNNAWGFIPGEGAGAVLLLSENALSRTGLNPLGRVMSIGKGIETNRIKTKTVCTGEGLTAAFREALHGLPPRALVTDVYCDMNGEPYRADEFGFTCLRTKESFLSASDFVASADCWGDVSAASPPLALAQAVIAGTKSYAKGAYALVWASSEGGERGATLIQVASKKSDL